jgi:hypothetical protein
MELEIEKSILQHIINGVEIEILNYKSDYVGIQYAKANGHYYLNGELYITYDGGSTGKSLNDCRLLLLNLSDLTKEIEHNGEKFVPILEILKVNGKWNRNIDRCLFDGAFIKEIGYHYGQPNNESFQISETIKYPISNVRTHEWLLKNHFDVFGLIEAGLAIDLNTINK